MIIISDWIVFNNTSGVTPDILALLGMHSAVKHSVVICTGLGHHRGAYDDISPVTLFRFSLPRV